MLSKGYPECGLARNDDVEPLDSSEKTEPVMTAAKNIYSNYHPAGVADNILPLVEGARVLEIGFGSGKLLQALAKRNNDVYGVDAGFAIVENAKKQGLKNVFLLDISEENLPFADDFFDAVYCYEVFEHLANPHRLFHETRRVLKKEHRFFFTCPTDDMMGYGPGRHTFVYPGLLEKNNLERFFMQMYFAIEYFRRDASTSIHHSCYILKNRKQERLPDILEVITGDYGIPKLYGHVIDEKRLDAEIERECSYYFSILKRAIEGQKADIIRSVAGILARLYGAHPSVRFQLANLLCRHGLSDAVSTSPTPEP